MAIEAEIIDSEIQVDGLSSKVGSPEHGATVVFLGITRNHHQERSVEYLEYECYRDMALSELTRISKQVAKQHAIDNLYVVHRIGRVNIGEASLGVAVSAPHRVEAFKASQDLVDELKKDVPIWKREFFSDGEVGWVEGNEIKPSSS